MDDGEWVPALMCRSDCEERQRVWRDCVSSLEDKAAFEDAIQVLVSSLSLSLSLSHTHKHTHLFNQSKFPPPQPSLLLKTHTQKVKRRLLQYVLL